MQVQCINKLQYSNNFQNKNKVLEDGDYVKIPKKQYQQDKIKENIVFSLLLLEIIYTIFKSITDKPPRI